MKKLVSLLMVVTMIMALSVVVYARFEPCSLCNSRLDYYLDERPGTNWCKWCGEDYPVTLTVKQYYCVECDHEEYAETIAMDGTCDCVGIAK